MQLPTDSHDFALWLFNTLENLSPIGNGGLWEGRLPDHIEFSEVEIHLASFGKHLEGPCRFDTRIIGFYPSYVHVYEDFQQLLDNAKNREYVPKRFTLRSSNFSYPCQDDSTKTPKEVTQYLQAVRLFSVLSDLADIRNGGIMFVQSHEAQLTITPEFRCQDLRGLESFPRFVAEFKNNESHSDQKRAIVRSVLIEQFRPRHKVTLADVLAKFEEVATDARHSLAMYVEEFSVAKVKTEVERQNLNDTLNLNRTLSEIQNQLLALPAAILLAGTTIKYGEVLRNYSVLAGIIIFALLILILIFNQCHSINSISTQVVLRKEKIKNMPSDSGSRILLLFTPLEKHVVRQKRILGFIGCIVFVVAVLTTLAVIKVSPQRETVCLPKSSSFDKELHHDGILSTNVPVSTNTISPITKPTPRPTSFLHH